MDISSFLDRYDNFRFDLKECLTSFVYKNILTERLHEFHCNIQEKNQMQVNSTYLLNLVRGDFSKNIPAYSSYSGLRKFSDLPVIDKSLVSVNPENFCDTSSHTTLWKKQSSGTTGNPFNTYSDACFYFEELFLPLRKIASSRKIDVGHRDIFSVTLMARWNWPSTVFQDPLEEVGLMARIPFDERSPSSISHLLELLVQMKPELIVAKPPLFEAVLGCTKNWGLLKNLESKLIVSSGCLMTDELRNMLIEAFNCPVVDAYALSEFGLVGTECQMQNGLHIDTTSVILEMFPSASDDRQEIVLSTIKNKGMPLVRYKTGDYGILDTSQCTCGNYSPKITRLIGKTIPCFWMADGTAFDPSRLNRIIFKNSHVKDFQVVHNKPGEIGLYVYIEDFLGKRNEIASMISDDFKKICPTYSSVQLEIYDYSVHRLSTDRYIQTK